MDQASDLRENPSAGQERAPSPDSHPSPASGTGNPADALPMLEIDLTAYRDGVAVHAHVQDSGFHS
jgi:hypothetical protein